VALYSISNYGQYSLNSLTSLIDSNPTLIGLFSASVVANQDGTYSLYVSSSNPSNYTMTDSSSNMNMGGGNVYKSEMAFEGIDALSISINPSLGAILQNVDPNAASNFSYYSNSWWGSSKSLYQNLIGSVASTVNVLQTSYSSMSSLVNSISSQVSQVQGVSLDQQYITLQNLQQDYQASASIVGILNNLMQTTLNMVNGG
jgi:flagellar hook-associated protein 1 FlgK